MDAMQISLTRPDIERFINEQVKAGHFSTPAEVVEAGVARLMCDPESDELDDATLAAIEEANAQIDRGEGIEFAQVAAGDKTCRITGSPGASG
jgi:Arc/MetJ-type ribon-helix-helix transcriptional regulator